MDFIELNDPKNVSKAMSEGKKLAIFEIDAEKNAIKFVSGINFSVSQNSEKTDNLIAPALSYLDVNYNKDIKLEYLADVCDISPSYFSRRFSAETGKSVPEYVREKRFSKACELLIGTDRTVVDIACSVGYMDCGYFNRLFRRSFGCTPLEYRTKTVAVDG